MDTQKVRDRMQAALDLLSTDIGSIRTGRATPALVEDIVIDAYGGQSKLRVNELATIAAVDVQTINVTPFDKSIIGEIKKGIIRANVGLTPIIDGDIIRISLPRLTTEDREKYVKLLSTKLESAKIMIRQARGEAMKSIKREFEDKGIGEDEKFRQEKELQKITDDFVAKIESIGEAKKKELLGMA